MFCPNMKLGLTVTLVSTLNWLPPFLVTALVIMPIELYWASKPPVMISKFSTASKFIGAVMPPSTMSVVSMPSMRKRA